MSVTTGISGIHYLWDRLSMRTVHLSMPVQAHKSSRCLKKHSAPL